MLVYVAYTVSCFKKQKLINSIFLLFPTWIHGFSQYSSKAKASLTVVNPQKTLQSFISSILFKMMNMFTLNSINGNYFTGQPSLL
jgi:hypothetical protein